MKAIDNVFGKIHDGIAFCFDNLAQLVLTNKYLFGWFWEKDNELNRKTSLDELSLAEDVGILAFQVFITKPMIFVSMCLFLVGGIARGGLHASVWLVNGILNRIFDLVNFISGGYFDKSEPPIDFHRQVPARETSDLSLKKESTSIITTDQEYIPPPPTNPQCGIHQPQVQAPQEVPQKLQDCFVPASAPPAHEVLGLQNDVPHQAQARAQTQCTPQQLQDDLIPMSVPTADEVFGPASNNPLQAPAELPGGNANYHQLLQGQRRAFPEDVSQIVEAISSINPVARAA